MMHYGIIEKYNVKQHGRCYKHKKFDKYLQQKYLSFVYKEKNETAIEFYQEHFSNDQSIQFALQKIYKFKQYTFAIDKTYIIIKLQRLWRRWKQTILKKYNIIFLMNRQIHQ